MAACEASEGEVHGKLLYAPASERKLAFMPRSTPSASSASSALTISSLPWYAALRCSRRSSTQRSGRPISRASAAMMSSSGNTCPFTPNPPPTSGAITRSLCSGKSMSSAILVRTMCGIWLEVQTVISPSCGS